MKHETRSGPGITINDLSHIRPEKAILLCKKLIIDLLKSLKMILNTHTGNTGSPGVFEGDREVRCRASVDLFGYRTTTHAKVLRSGQTLAQLDLGPVVWPLGSWG